MTVQMWVPTGSNAFQLKILSNKKMKKILAFIRKLWTRLLWIVHIIVATVTISIKKKLLKAPKRSKILKIKQFWKRASVVDYLDPPKKIDLKKMCVVRRRLRPLSQFIKWEVSVLEVFDVRTGRITSYLCRFQMEYERTFFPELTNK